MIRAERFNIITSLADEMDVITFEELAEHLNVSVATARRDVEELASQGIVEKTRGGIIFCSKKQQAEPSTKLRSLINTEEKKRIAQAAFRYIEENALYFFDSGSTVHELIKLIPKSFPLSIVTYDLSYLVELDALEEADVFILGGQLRHGHFGCHGIYAENFLDQMNANVAFIGADSVDPSKGIMSFNSYDPRLKQKMIENSACTVLLCDHTKFEKHGFFSIHDFEGIDLIITDSGTDPLIIQQLRNKGVNIETV